MPASSRSRTARAPDTGQPHAREPGPLATCGQLRDGREAEDRVPELEARVIGFATNDAKAQSPLVEADRRVDVVDEQLDAESHGGVE